MRTKQSEKPEEGNICWWRANIWTSEKSSIWVAMASGHWGRWSPLTWLGGCNMQPAMLLIHQMWEERLAFEYWNPHQPEQSVNSLCTLVLFPWHPGAEKVHLQWWWRWWWQIVCAAPPSLPCLADVTPVSWSVFQLSSFIDSGSFSTLILPCDDICLSSQGCDLQI